ncbi:putative protein tyrosine phosphatase [Heterostelium album PN500]|uniref:protein-tyrosine-phosphatase n=1 Tax=Heterostelium pallidum (strain ATCC 26659 / Pp 5 / PN500) TaxID=670386 RepID=D3BNB6_HETP5|nr:putative protein tyrosine phosphatase [Heterostelium album PN500]EFA76776.1 putative protein tyrosine phosphatase [Heterostelium album PN500]|eukprot:XP_020428908.1 putative protein tyrosine phosphatase [Heterostelium album PN500]
MVKNLRDYRIKEEWLFWTFDYLLKYTSLEDSVSFYDISKSWKQDCLRIRLKSSFENYDSEIPRKMSNEEINKIFPGFYIGSLAAVKRDILDEYQITHVLSIMNGYKAKWPKMYKCHVIDIFDMEGVDIKQYFDQTFEFIEEGRREGAVLVHCFAGMSRSASICIAYMMRKLNIDYSDAHGLLLDARRIIYPNRGFVKQLMEYEEELIERKKQAEKEAKRQAKLELKQQQQLQQEAEQLVTETGEKLSQLQVESLVADEEEEEEEEDEGEIKYCCRKCGKALFYPKDISKHDRGDGQNSFKWGRREKTMSGSEECTSYFLKENEWVEWITTSPETYDGKIICDNPKCGEKLGSWSWSGAQCSCGSWISPSFQIPKSRVDEKFVKNPPIIPVKSNNTNTTASNSTTTNTTSISIS